MTLANEIAELVYTRVSHDIIGNVGAVSNAVELLEEGDMEFLDDISGILKTSSSVLSARLKFFRLAFGLSNTGLDQLDSVRKITDDYLKTIGGISTKITASLLIENTQFSKIAILSVMIIADTLAKGGEIEVREYNNDLLAQAISDSSLSKERVEAVKAAIKGEFIEKSAQYAPVFYLKTLLDAMGYHIAVADGENFGFIIRKS